jgi:hypothetical protein
MKNEQVYFCDYCNTLRWFEEIDTEFWACRMCNHELHKLTKAFTIETDEKEPTAGKVINTLLTSYQQDINKLLTISKADGMVQSDESGQVINNTS